MTGGRESRRRGSDDYDRYAHQKNQKIQTSELAKPEKYKSATPYNSRQQMKNNSAKKRSSSAASGKLQLSRKSKSKVTNHEYVSLPCHFQNRSRLNPASRGAQKGFPNNTCRNRSGIHFIRRSRKRERPISRRGSIKYWRKSRRIWTEFPIETRWMVDWARGTSAAILSADTTTIRRTTRWTMTPMIGGERGLGFGPVGSLGGMVVMTDDIG